MKDSVLFVFDTFYADMLSDLSLKMTWKSLFLALTRKKNIIISKVICCTRFFFFFTGCYYLLSPNDNDDVLVVNESRKECDVARFGASFGLGRFDCISDLVRANIFCPFETGVWWDSSPVLFVCLGFFGGARGLWSFARVCPVIYDTLLFGDRRCFIARNSVCCFVLFVFLSLSFSLFVFSVQRKRLRLAIPCDDSAPIAEKKQLVVAAVAASRRFFSVPPFAIRLLLYI